MNPNRIVPANDSDLLAYNTDAVALKIYFENLHREKGTNPYCTCSCHYDPNSPCRWIDEEAYMNYHGVTPDGGTFLSNKAQNEENENESK